MSTSLTIPIAKEHLSDLEVVDVNRLINSESKKMCQPWHLLTLLSPGLSPGRLSERALSRAQGRAEHNAPHSTLIYFPPVTTSDGWLH